MITSSIKREIRNFHVVSRGVTVKTRTEKANSGNEDVNEDSVLRKGIRHTHFNELFVPN